MGNLVVRQPTEMMVVPDKSIVAYQEGLNLLSFPSFFLEDREVRGEEKESSVIHLGYTPQ